MLIMIYIGPRVPSAKFIEEMQPLKPAVLALYATSAEAAPGSIEMVLAVRTKSVPRPMFAFGGPGLYAA